VLEAAPWRPEKLIALGRASTSIHQVDFGDEQVRVHDLATQDWGLLDGAILAVPRESASAAIDIAVSAGVPVVDCSGSQFDQLDVPLVVPWLNAEVMDAPRTRDVFAVPSAVSIMLATVLQPLVKAGYDDGAEATVLMPASHWGREGVSELSQQVVAMFNAGTPPRRVFPDGFAFDVTPQVGAAGVSGWTGTELQAVTETYRLCGMRCAVSMMGVPLFSGLGAEVRLQVEEGAVAEDIVQVLRRAGLDVYDGPVGRSVPRPRRVEGEVYPRVGRVRASPVGDAVYMWVAMDNLHATAAAAVGTLAMSLRVGTDED
jgi:aspartate-semialdehyde dehydrogenase